MLGFSMLLISLCAMQSVQGHSVILNDDQLSMILPEFRAHEPNSYQIQATIRNHLAKKYNWPGTEFIADEFPKYSVIILRPINGSKDYEIRYGACYVVYSRSAENLNKTIREEGFADWTKHILFIGVPRPEGTSIIRAYAKERGGRVSEENGTNPDNTNIFLVRPKIIIRRSLPPGFRLGELSLEHAEQVNGEWQNGTPETLIFHQQLLRMNFPSSAIFCNEDNRLVAYLLYQPDGTMGLGYVNPSFRRRGFFQIVNYDLARKVVAMGQPVPFVRVLKSNTASQKAYEKLGAEKVDENVYSIDKIVYDP